MLKAKKDDYRDNGCAHLAIRVDVGKTIPNVAYTEVEFCLTRV